MSIRQSFAALCCIVLGSLTLHRDLLLEATTFLAAACVIVAMPRAALPATGEPIAASDTEGK